MQLDKVILFAADLTRVDSSFADIRPTFAKQATIVFTNGKSDPRWLGTRALALGATFPGMIEVNEPARTCSGACLVDLFAILTQSQTPAWVTPQKTIPPHASPGNFRVTTVLTIVHELHHVMQGWQIGKRYRADYREEVISATNRSEDYAKANAQMEDNGYIQNVFESGAFDFGNRWSAQHLDEVHAGKFDFLLPMTTMRGVFPDVPGVYL
jgi:hypothetical protein